MPKNEGKKFEDDWKNSVPEWVYYYRFRDGTANFAGEKNENVRFQARNMCDCMLFYDGKLFLLELKSYRGKSIPFSAITGGKKLEEMSKAGTYRRIISGYVFNFRDIVKTFFVKANDVEHYIYHADRKSIPIDWTESKGVEIESRKLISRYRYDIKKFLEGI
ncbi:MAG: Holliday junction resolvase RecU [Deltaproteobacteria bacterium]|nr:Holliday junction resolvase RecU [Deltaproteobacteria bacterium]